MPKKLTYLKRLYSSLFVGLLLIQAAFAQLPNVLVLHANPNTPWTIDIINKLSSTGQFSGISYLDISTTTPTLSYLQTFRAVLLATDYPPQNSIGLGNVLAQYIDGGGGVVSTAFTNASVPVTGTYGSATYWVMVPPGTQSSGGSLFLGSTGSSHPIMSGVTSFSAGTSSFRSTSFSLVSGAYPVAYYNTGEFLVAARENAGTTANRRRVDLNFYPVSSDIRSDLYIAASSGPRLIANALTWVSAQFEVSSMSISPTANCYAPGSTFTLNYQVTNSFSNGNTFFALLSSSNGSFASPTTIGSVNATGSGSITCTIPPQATASSSYAIKIFSTNPSKISNLSISNLSIGNPINYYLDSDRDGYFTGSVLNTCTNPGANYVTSGVISGGDCNDNNSAINPAAAEITCNSIDENCNGTLDDDSVAPIFTNFPANVTLTAAPGACSAIHTYPAIQISENCPSTLSTGKVYLRSSSAGEPWGSNENINAMNTAFGSGLWTSAFFESTPAASIFSTSNRFVFIEGSQNGAITLASFLSTNQSLIENWVNLGGALFINAAPNVGSSFNMGFGNTILNYSAPNTYSGNASQMVSHPIFNGPFLPAAGGYSGNNFSHAIITGTSILGLVNGNAGLVLGYKTWGAGLVAFGGMTITNFHSPQPNATNLRLNILRWLDTSSPGISPNTVTQIAGLASGASYPIGTTTNTFRSQDGRGNQRTRSFTVTVQTNPADVWFMDADNDGYTVGNGISSCSSPGTGYRKTGILGAADCNDANSNINPGRVEITCNQVDDNCNGMADDDATPPSLTLSSNLTVSVNSGSCTVPVMYSAPVATDNCSIILGNGKVYMRSASGEPWGSSENVTAMNLAFGTGQWTLRTFETTTGSSVFNATNRLVFMDGSEWGANALNTFLNTNRTVIESWVNSGGSLFINAAPNTGSDILFGFGGVMLMYNGGSTPMQSVLVNSPAGSILQTPFTPSGFINLTGNSVSHALIVGAGLTNLITGNFGVALAYKSFGFGKVMFGGMTTTNFHSPSPNGRNLRTNALHWLNAQVPNTIITLQQTAGLPSGSAFPIGVTTNTFSATDGNGNITTKSFTVTVTTPDIWYQDVDNDGYYYGIPYNQCTSPGPNYVLGGNRLPGDCDDNNPALYPGLSEICGNSIDDNCDGSIDEGCSACAGIPTRPLSIIGPVTGVCPGSRGVLYYVEPQANVDSFFWIMPPQTTLVNGQGTNRIFVNFSNNFANANIKVRTVNACGQSANQQNTVYADPVVVKVNGPTGGFCGGQTGVIWSVDSIPTVSAYNWTVPSGVTITSGQGTRTITANVSSNFVSGRLCVNATNNCGTGGSKCYDLTARPAAPTGMLGSNNLCSGAAGVLRLSPVNGATSYNWTLPSGFAATSGSGTATLGVNWGTTAGSVSVSASNACGTGTAFTKNLTVRVCKLDEDLQANEGQAALQWSVYPNPTSGYFKLNLIGLPEDESFEMNWFDLTGRKVYAESGLILGTGTEVERTISDLPSGVYLIQLYNANRHFNHRITIE